MAPAIKFDTREGLPSSEVYDVEVDSFGRIWMTTDRGVCQYDGYEFKSFGPRDGLATTTNLKVGRDLKNGFWYIGMDGSLSHWANGVFVPAAASENIQNLLGPGRWILHTAMNEKGELLFAYHAKGGVSYKYLVPGAAEIHDADWDSLSQCYKSWKYGSTDLIQLPNAVLSNKAIVAGATSRDQRFLYFVQGVEKETHTLICLDRMDSTAELKVGFEGIILDIFVAENDDIWVCTTSGLYRFRRGDLSLPPQKYFDDLALTAIIRDLEGNFWISTLSNGVLFVPSFGFEQMAFALGPNHTPTSLVGMENHLVIGMQEGQILALDTALDQSLLVNTPEYFGMYKNGSAYQNRSWFVGGLITETAEGLVAEKSSFGRHSFTQVMELSSGELLHSGRLGYQVTGKDGTIRFDSRAKLPHRIFCTLECGGDIWIGSLKGLYRCKNGNFSDPQIAHQEISELNTRINDICPGGGGNVWAASIGSGLFYLTGERVFHIDKQNGLSSDMINSIFLINDSTLLAGSNRGLDLIKFKGDEGFQLESIQSIGPEDGLWGQFIRDVVFWRGQVWLATSKGLLHCALEQMVAAPIPPPKIFVEAVMVDNQTIDENQRLGLRHNQNDLVFHFSGISQRKPRGSSFYRFRLVRDGVAGAWNFTNDRSVQYYNLAPGNYEFVAMARNLQGQWSSEPIEYEFRIQPHFSQTLWFKALVVGCTLGLVALMFLWYRRRLRRQDAEERKLNKIQLRAQAAEIAALRNQINPHFIFNVLNSIQNYFMKNDLINANRYLGKFSRLMRDGLQFSNRQRISLQTELDFLTTYLELEQMRFPEKFSFAFELDPDIDPQTALLPPFLFQPILENAIKHAFKDIQYPGRLEINIHFSDIKGFLDITIEDNGPGFKEASKPVIMNKGVHESLGIDLVRQQIQLFNVEFGVENADFYLEDLCFSSPDRHGVRAVFRIPIQYPISA